MKTIANVVAVLSVAGLGLVQGPASVSAAETETVIVKPFKAINLSSGTKRAIGYYVADAGGCQLTLQIADKYSDYANSVSDPVRINVAVREGTSARVDSMVGPSLDFSCAMGAGQLSIQTVEKTAYAAPAK